MKSIGARLVAISALLTLIGTGCPWWGQTDGNGANTHVLNEDMDITTVVYGRAFNKMGEPLKGVTVELLGDKVYTTTTDERGYYRFPEVFIAHAKALIGQGSTSSNATQIVQGQDQAQTACGYADDDMDCESNSDEGVDNARNETSGNDTRDIQTIAYYTILFRHDDLATFRDNVVLEANAFRTGNSYSYEVTPHKFDAMLVAFAKICFKVLLGVDDDGSPIPAEGARVGLMHDLHADHEPGDQESGHAFDSVDSSAASHVEFIPASTTADVNGRACFDEDDRLPATPDYMVTVAPYDMNPDDEDGVEYGLYWEWIDLTPYDPFTMDHSEYWNMLPEAIIDLRDSFEPTLQVAFSSPRDGGEIGPNAPIRVYWNMPVDPDTVTYYVAGCSGSCNNDPNNPDPMVLSTELERTSLTLGIAVVDELSVLFDNWVLVVTATTYGGQTRSFEIDFELDDSHVPPGVMMPTAMLDPTSADMSMSENYWTAVDAAAIYAFDSQSRDQDSYIGSLFVQDNFTTAPDDSTYWYGLGTDYTLPLKWMNVAGARGYNVFIRDTHFLTSWTRVASYNASTEWEPGDYFRANVNLNQWYVDGHTFCCGEALLVAVIPYFDVDNPTSSMPALDPNAILALSDNYGAAVAPYYANGGQYWGYGNPDEIPSEWCGQHYDDYAIAAFSEFMDDGMAPAILTDTSGDGIFPISGRYDLDWVRWIEDFNGPTRYSAWKIMMQSPWVDTSELYIGDYIRDTDGDGICRVIAIDECGGNSRIYVNNVSDCDEDGWWMSLPAYELLGPVRDAADPERTVDTSWQGDTLVVDAEMENDIWQRDEGWQRLVLDVDGTPYIVDPDTSWQDLGDAWYRAYFNEINGVGIPEGINFTTSTVTLTNQLTVTIAQDVSSAEDEIRITGDSTRLNGNRLATILDADGDLIEIISIGSVNDGVLNLNHDLTYPHAAGTVIAFYPVFKIRDATESADSTIYADDPNDVWCTSNGNFYNNTDVLALVGSGATQELVRVTNSNCGNDWIQVDSDPANGSGEGLAFNHLPGELVQILPASVNVHGIIQEFDNGGGGNNNNYNDTMGLRPGFEVTMTTECDDCDQYSLDDTYTVHTYNVCAIVGERVVLDHSTGMDGRGSSDKIFDIDYTDIRPADVLWVGANDASGNAMRSDQNTLHCDYDIQ
jgi:hypothetical protein